MFYIYSDGNLNFIFFAYKISFLSVSVTFFVALFMYSFI